MIWYMCSGLITIGPDIGDSKNDIIDASKHQVGYLANTIEKYAQLVEQSLINYESEKLVDMRK